METTTIQGNMGDPWESLANAIIIQAVKDYRLAVKSKETSMKAAKTIKECEIFFRSKYFKALTEVDPEYLIDKLRKETEQSGRN